MATRTSSGWDFPPGIFPPTFDLSPRHGRSTTTSTANRPSRILIKRLDARVVISSGDHARVSASGTSEYTSLSSPLNDEALPIPDHLSPLSPVTPSASSAPVLMVDKITATLCGMERQDFCISRSYSRRPLFLYPDTMWRIIPSPLRAPGFVSFMLSP